jgi:NAD(P)-dependent dehydrogenase (short-subunit alcohol dehydrogenase family)
MSRVLITGVSRGIGEGLLRSYLEAGHEVHGMGRSAPEWALTYGERFRFYACDLADLDSLVPACRAVASPIDTIICSAADFGADAYLLEQFDNAAFVHTFAVNCIAPAILVKELKPRLEAGIRRHIVLMSTGNASLSGNTSGSMLAYRTSKSALNQLMRNVAAEWGPNGFVAVSLNPGWVRTRMGGANAPTSVEQAAAEIAYFCENLMRPELNGHFCNVDGSEVPW